MEMSIPKRAIALHTTKIKYSFKVAVSLLATMLLAACSPSAVDSKTTVNADEVHFETIIVKNKNVEIETFVFGEGERTLIIAAGNGRPGIELEELARNIATTGMRVAVFNYRTIGASSGPIAGITLHDYAQDVWSIADALGAEKVHLAGKTYGNRVMRTASADHPERTLSVTLVGSGGVIMPSKAIIKKYKRYVSPGISQEEWLKLQTELNFAPGNEHLASRSGEYGSFPKLAGAQIESSDATPKSEWTHGGTSPMMVLTCLLDLVAVPENALLLAKERADTWLVGIPGCAHNMVFEEPIIMAGLIVQYIESVEARP
jgi:pimeloyl-ACP methyl ester carboxylesterase